MNDNVVAIRTDTNEVQDSIAWLAELLGREPDIVAISVSYPDGEVATGCFGRTDRADVLWMLEHHKLRLLGR